MKIIINQQVKMTIELKTPTSCIKCPFFESDSYQDMGATISYVTCNANQFKEDGRILAQKFEVHPFAYNRYNKDHKPKEFIYQGCTLFKKGM